MSLNKPWYVGGLKFGCTQCGKCCTGSPGFVWLDETDIMRLSHHLELSREDFLKQYTRQVYGRYSLLECNTTYDCVFLKNNRCTVYEARPSQCRTFPWWESLLESPKYWEEAKGFCEGIDHIDGKTYSYEEIEEALKES